MSGEYRGRGFGRGRFQSWKRGRGGGSFSGKWREREHRTDLSKATGKHTSGRKGQGLFRFFSFMKESIMPIKHSSLPHTSAYLLFYVTP